MSIAIEELPNYFIFNGPYNCGGNGAAIPPIEAEGDYSRLRKSDKYHKVES